MVVLTDDNEYRIKEIIMRDGKVYKVTGYTLEDFLAMAPKLIQINIGEVASTDAVEGFSHDTICLKGIVINGRTRTLTLARTFRKNFLDYINS